MSADPHRQSTPESARYLGFDFGTCSIGVAVGNALTGTASPCGVIRAQQGRPDWDALDPLLAQWQPAGLVVGLPLHMDAGESEMSAAARRFSRRLAARYHLPAFMVDERLSSREASGRMDGKVRIQSKAQNDAAAACLILETWLQECRD